MIGLDTNVLVRFLVQDDRTQFERAQKLIKSEARTHGVFISLLVLLETEWVLRSRYGLLKNDFIRVLSELLESADLQIEDEPSVEVALFWWKDSSAEFVDCLISARHRALGCRATASFDVKATKVPGFVAL